jgi:uncharacterized protein
MSVAGLSASRRFEGYAGAIVTGASSGLGEAMVKRIHALNENLPILCISRSKPILHYPENILKHVSCDLSNGAAIKSCFPEVENFMEALVVDGKLLLINNSGVGAYGSFPEEDFSKLGPMIDLNVRAVVHLTSKLHSFIVKRGGAIVNVSSLAAFQPTPFLSVYGATKAFLLHWSLSLREELRDSDVQVLAVCPGPIRTNFFRAAGFTRRLGNVSGREPDDVAVAVFHSLFKGRAVMTFGFRDWFLAVVAARLPRTWLARLSGSILRKLRLERFNKAQINDE